MNIFFVAAEVGPFAHVGGLSQVMYFLPRSLIKLGHDVRIFTPKYGRMDETGPAQKPWSLRMEYEGLKVPVQNSRFAKEKDGNGNGQTEPQNLICNIKSYRRKKSDPLVYFLENREYYELRANVFSYKDDHVRFALLSKGALEWLLKLKRQNGWVPDVIHINDWHTSYVAELARTDDRYRQALHKVPLVLTVHNFKFQGNYDFQYAKERDNIHEPLAPLLTPDLQKQNALARGLYYADAVNTVSPTHAIEVLTPEYAEGLGEILAAIRGKFIGILNGLDTHEFNPALDPIIKKKYNKKFFIHARRENKREVQKLFSLPQDHFKPLIIMAGRITQQKGWEELLPVIPKLLAEKPETQLIVLGRGDDRYQKELDTLRQSFPNQLGLHLRSDFKLPRKLFAAGDIILIPSLYEPGGIVALEALRYGAVPIVRRTGGLNDIIEDFNPATGRGNGFSFKAPDSWALYGAIVEALTIYRQPQLWKKLVRNCLTSNFSWDIAAKKYEEWYESITQEHKRALSILSHEEYTVNHGASL